MRRIPDRRGKRGLPASAALCAALGTPACLADVAPASDAQAAAEQQAFAVHAQFTYVEQETSGFNAPYRGPNSLSSNAGRETTDATLYLGARLWSGAEGWLVPEVDQGFGLDDTLGVAGFPSGEAYKVGRDHPYFRLPRAFVRESIDLGGDRQPVEADLMQLAGTHAADRLVLTVGKFAVTDIFDALQYAHDPRGDFLNWAAVDAGTFDYAADAWGLTVGAALEWYQDVWTLRTGIFDLSDVPNSTHLEPAFHEFQLVAEIERRHELGGQPGKILITAFNSRGRMGLLDEALTVARETGQPVDVAAVRRYRSRPGVDLSLEQQISPDIGLFARAGKDAGNVEAYEFSDIDRTTSVGLSLAGSRWRRVNDRVGIAAIMNGISGIREAYLDAGGLGILVGDGRLPHPGPEQIIESYYEAGVFAHLQLTFDYQWVRNPAYNQDRGPVSIFALRVHAQL